LFIPCRHVFAYGLNYLLGFGDLLFIFFPPYFLWAQSARGEVEGRRGGSKKAGGGKVANRDGETKRGIVAPPLFFTFAFEG
jgi:hypothetical protein